MLLGGPSSSSTTSDYPDNIGIMFKFGPLPLIVTTREDGNYTRASGYVYICIYIYIYISSWYSALVGGGPTQIIFLYSLLNSKP